MDWLVDRLEGWLVGCTVCQQHAKMNLKAEAAQTVLLADRMIHKLFYLLTCDTQVVLLADL